MSLIQSLHVDSKPKKVNVFVVPAMGLSSARATMTPHSFTVIVKAEELIEYLEPTYAEWVEESKRDDGLCGGPQDELAEAGYLSLWQLLERPSLLRLVVGGYLAEDFLRKFTWDGSSQIEYWLDTVDDCRVAGNLIFLSGVCYSKIDKK